MKKSLFALFIAFLGITTIHTATAQTYDPYAVQVINNLIANNGLQATPDAPETWGFAKWNDEKPKKTIELHFGGGNDNLNGEVSFRGLTTLKELYCRQGMGVTAIDATDCLELLTLYCDYQMNLTSLNLTNCKQLQTLNTLYCQKLSILELTDCKQLQTLNCEKNILKHLILTNCTQLQTLNCQGNLLPKLDLTGCTQLEEVDLRCNSLTEIDLTVLNKLTDFYGDAQFPRLNLYGNDTTEYSCIVFLNNPTFENEAISYSDGILKSADKTVKSTSFNVETGHDYYKLSGIITFIYSNIGIDSPDELKCKIYFYPHTDILFVEYDDFYTIKLYDMLGKDILTRNGYGKAEVNVSHLLRGTYIVSVFSKNKMTGSTKIVKH